MRLTVAKNLNIRIHSPRVNAPCYNYLTPGTTIEVEGLPIKGDSVYGNDLWYKDLTDDFYYWSGGFFQKEEKALAFLSTDFNFKPKIDHWWITDYGIDKIWEQTRGAGVKIAIIDSGLDYNHSNIKNKKNIQYYNVITNTFNDYDCLPNKHYHGTKCAGIIAAQGPELYGVAPESDLLIIKATTASGSLDPDKMILAIKKAIELKSDIISISYSYKEKGMLGLFDQLQEVVKEAVMNGILIVAAVGDATTTNPVSDRFPASFPYSLSVGSVNRDKKLSNYTLNENVDLLAPGENISVLSINDLTILESGTSLSVPFVAGVCALYISKTKDKNIDYLRNTLKTDSLYKEELKQEMLKYTTINIPHLGIINVKKLFNI